MEPPKDLRRLSKVYYRPIEAAIRWSGLARHERRILKTLNGRRSPEADQFPRWPALRLNTERIYDAIRHDELPYGIAGVTVRDGSHIEDANLTVRHVDLRAWMVRYYPDETPAFLFAPSEPPAQIGIDLDAVHALVLEREAFRSLSEERERALIELKRSQAALMRTAEARSSTPTDELGPRSELTYLHIIGAFLTVLLGRSPAGQRYSSFETQDAIIAALIAHHGGRLGITERTLAAKFAAARRALSK